MAPQTDNRGRTFEYNRWYPSKKVKATLRPLAMHVAQCRAAVEDAIKGLPDEELAALIEAVEAGDFGRDNCWWAEHELVGAFRYQIVNEPRRRTLPQEPD